MNTLITFRRIAALAAAWLTCVAATSAPPATIYLRLPQVRTAPPVRNFTYDAIATVPAVPGTPASLMPPDTVEATLLMPTSAMSTLRASSTWPSLVIVEANGDGTVIRRTTFRHVSISALRSVQKADGSLERVRFRAASVDVSVPREVVAKTR